MRQRPGQIFVQLGHRPALAGEGVLVDDELELAIGVLGAGLDLGVALHLVDKPRDFLGQLGKFGRVVAGEGDGEPAARHGGHRRVRRRAGNHLAGQSFGAGHHLVHHRVHLAIGGYAVVHFQVEHELVEILGPGVGGRRGDHRGRGRAVDGRHGADTLHGKRRVHNLVGHGEGIVLLGSLGHGHGQGDRPGRHGGKKRDTHACGPDHRDHQKARGHQERQRLMAQSELQRASVGTLHLPGEVVAARAVAAKDEPRERRHEREGHHERGGEHVGEGEREGHHHLVDHARGECDGHKDADGGQRGGHHGAGYLLGALNRRPGRADAAPAQAVDVLQHHHGVVDEHADGQ